ncbi:CheW domain-containing protein [Pseudomonas typographi]|uniref:Chemotaxis protein CheW n=1 Tax=Pseudomonas typographi TaxID=2715964 RepID=A0ABR7Z510_9PSED|nr:CheW domain-containing protein [Pseudomonas typographi]MBD1553929.1 chemotaxis protein CheW [Pseudomonas typographi]MBD1600438.1 chemotaxis protein CheW [Pseudomonas typographi]
MNPPVDFAKRPQQALQAYLDGLLQDIPEALEPDVLLATASDVALGEFHAAVREEQLRDAHRPAAALRAEPLIQPDDPMPWATPPLPQLATPLLQQALRVAPLAEVHLSAPVPEPVPQPAQLLMPAHASRHGGGLHSDGPPAWATGPFECLLFDVAGLTLAVPLVCLGSIYPLAGQELTPLFGQPEWFLGILPSHSGNLKVLDTARWVMPDRYRADFLQGLQYVISVQGYEWGLAVHHVSRSLRLDPSEIKWRSQRGQRPWLAGTVIEHMCALLDVAALAELIASGAITRQMQETKEKAAAEAKAKAAAQRPSKH